MNAIAAGGRLCRARYPPVDLVRTRLKDPVLLPLAANYGDREDLAGLESITNGWLQAQEAGLPELDPRELVFGRAGYTFINAAFTHRRPIVYSLNSKCRRPLFDDALRSRPSPRPNAQRTRPPIPPTIGLLKRHPLGICAVSSSPLAPGNVS